ncbi:hypothetical protein ABH941_000518 [Streptacidiphilus sp. EB103A]
MGMPMINPPRRVAVLADSDSRWKWGAALARRIAAEATLDAYFLNGRATPTERQLAEVGVVPDSSCEVTIAEFLADPRVGEADVLILALVGGGAQALLHGTARAWSALPRRPVVITGYVGVVYEKLTDGLLLRAGSDIVLANTTADAERFREVLAGVGADPGSVVETALPFLGGAQYVPAPEERRFTVCFAAQPSAPRSRSARRQLLERAAQHARRYPDRDVLVKLRSLPGEQTTHVEDFPYQRLLHELTIPAPFNLDLVYGHMSEVLDRTDLLVTVSSTAALESLHRSIPTAVLTDFGVREPLGNHYFIGSGCLASWDELDTGIVPVPDQRWLRRHGVLSDEPYRALRERISELRGLPEMPSLVPYYSESRASGYQPALLRRYGLDPKGAPLVEAPAPDQRAGALNRIVRRTVRRSARSCYRLGAQRVAPVIRRWGQL